MRRLLTFRCEGAGLGATLDEGPEAVGLLMATGGTQTRIGSHRLYERLAKHLSGHGFPCLRYDRRGVGDSGGEDPGYLQSGPDVLAASAAFRAAAPGLRTVLGFGLCDGATALALHAAEAGLDALVLVNPWLVEVEDCEPAPAAARAYYAHRLADPSAWKRLLSGGVDLRRLGRSLSRAAAPLPVSPLAEQVFTALAAADIPVSLILARGDNTAVAAAAEVERARFRPRLHVDVDTDSHTFARAGDTDRLAKIVLQILREAAASTH